MLFSFSRECEMTALRRLTVTRIPAFLSSRLSSESHPRSLNHCQCRMHVCMHDSGTGLQVHRDSEENNAKTPFTFTPDNLKKAKAVIANYPEGHQVP